MGTALSIACASLASVGNADVPPRPLAPMNGDSHGGQGLLKGEGKGIFLPLPAPQTGNVSPVVSKGALLKNISPLNFALLPPSPQVRRLLA